MKFIKKPIPVEAVQYFKGGTPIPGVCYGQCINQTKDDAPPHIHTLENHNGHTVSEGDWIITGVRGEHYAIKPDIFAETYETAPEPGEAFGKAALKCLPDPPTSGMDPANDTATEPQTSVEANTLERPKE